MAKMESDKTDMTQDKALVKKAIKQHDTQQHKGSKGTKLKLKSGGSINAKMKTMGRNLARAANQSGSSRGG
jgi:hypothetical protein